MPRLTGCSFHSNFTKQPAWLTGYRLFALTTEQSRQRQTLVTNPSFFPICLAAAGFPPNPHSPYPSSIFLCMHSSELVVVFSLKSLTFLFSKNEGKSFFAEVRLVARVPPCYLGQPRFAVCNFTTAALSEPSLSLSPEKITSTVQPTFSIFFFQHRHNLEGGFCNGLLLLLKLFAAAIKRD